MAPKAAFFRQVVDAAPDAAVVVDEAGAIVFANARCLPILGYEPAELEGRPVEILVPDGMANHPERRASYFANAAVRSMGKRPILSARHKSGALVPVDIALSPLPPSPGGPRLVLAVLRDALPMWEAQRRLVLNDVAMSAAANGIVITDLDGNITWVNPAVTRITGYEQGELVGRHTRVLKSGLHGEEFYLHLWETVLSGQTWAGEIANRRKTGEIYYEEQQISPVRDDEGRITHFIAIKQDVTARKRAEAELKQAHAELQVRLAQIEELHRQLSQQALRDPLTNLFNRRYFDETLAREIARARRDGAPLSLVIMDVDRFKDVNDERGHQAGDEALKQLAVILEKSIRKGDVACRMGGDEFLVLMPGAPCDAARGRAEVWRESFARLGLAAKGGSCTLSMGVAELRPGESHDDLVRRADKALYEAKNGGRNRVEAA